MTLGEAERRWRESCTDTVSAKYLWSREAFAAWYSEAESEAAIRARLIFDDCSAATELALVAGDRRADIDQSITEIRKAWLVDAASRVHHLIQVTRKELDRTDPRWRERTGMPTLFVHEDKSVALNRIADAAYAVQMEVYRGPMRPLIRAEDRPEIATAHPFALFDWVDFRAYSIPDVDTEHPGKAAASLSRFEAHFGNRPTAGYVRRNAANRPHKIKAW